MSPRIRRWSLLLAAVCLLPAVLRVAWAMPAFGDHPLPYGDAINALAPIQRHVTNMVSAVNFDYRGLDTLGEESMLLAAVTGASILLRGNRGEGLSARAGEIPDRPISPRSEVLAPLVRLIGPVTTIFGLYVAAHAMTTPGGGFQGGVIIASGLLLIFLGQDYRVWRRIVKSEMMDACEGAGAALYGLAGFASMSMGATFLTNILPLGQLKDVFSGGLMLVENAGVALAVAGGFTVLLIEFLEETRAENGEGAP